MMKLLEQLQELIYESRIDDFKKKYRYLPLSPELINYIIAHEPSKNYKYLDWIGKIIFNEHDIYNIDFEFIKELMEDLEVFNRKSKGVDIYSFKTFSSFDQYIQKLKKEKSKRQRIFDQADLLFNNKNWLIVAPQTHEACRFFGGSTRWCVSTSNSGYWDEYYNERGNDIIILIDRKNKEKYAVVKEPDGSDVDYATIYDDQDNPLSREQKAHLFSILQDEYDTANVSAYEVIDYYKGDGDERIQKYKDEIVETQFENEHDKFATDVMNTIADEAGLDPEMVSFWWKDIVDATFGDREEYRSFLYKAYIAPYHNHGDTDMAGHFDDYDDLYSELNSFDETSELEFLYDNTRKLGMGMENLINQIELILGKGDFDRFLRRNEDGFYEALRDVFVGLSKKINDPNQMQFDTISGKLKITVRGLKHLLDLFYRYGHVHVAEELYKLLKDKPEFKKELYS